MDINRNGFKLIVLATVLISLIGFIAEYLPFFTNYENLEEQLNQGLIFETLNPNMIILVIIIPLLINLTGLILLYLFNPIGRLLYTISILLILIIVMLSGDSIEYSLLYPFEYVGSFLEVFIAYLVYFTPLKKEFDKT
jgi:hypothetical protein